MSDSRTFGLTFKEVLLIDSTTIRLFSDIHKGVGRNPRGDGKKKGGLKVHMLIDAVQSVGRFIKITEAKVHDKNFLKSLELTSHSMIVFDKAYNYYHQFAIWTQKQVCYQDEQNRYYEFLTNSFEIPAEEVAFLYKKRWGIELLFMKMKLNFQLHYFFGENENAIRTQVWCTLIAQLLLTVIQKIAQTKKAFSVVAALVRMHLISMLDVNELLRSTNRDIFNNFSCSENINPDWPRKLVYVFGAIWTSLTGTEHKREYVKAYVDYTHTLSGIHDIIEPGTGGNSAHKH